MGPRASCSTTHATVRGASSCCRRTRPVRPAGSGAGSGWPDRGHIGAARPGRADNDSAGELVAKKVDCSRRADPVPSVIRGHHPLGSRIAGRGGEVGASTHDRPRGVDPALPAPGGGTEGVVLQRKSSAASGRGCRGTLAIDWSVPAVVCVFSPVLAGLVTAQKALRRNENREEPPGAWTPQDAGLDRRVKLWCACSPRRRAGDYAEALCRNRNRERLSGRGPVTQVID